MKAPAALLALAFLAATTAAAAGKRPQPLLAGLPQSEVRAVTAAGEHRFRVWIAADPDSRARGLMYVRAMPADHGMLFLFERAQVASFWMKNTYLPLDLVFIRGDGTVANVARDARPGSLDPITSSAPVIAVLELLAGTAARIGLLPGDRIVFADAAALEGRDAGRGQRGQ